VDIDRRDTMSTEVMDIDCTGDFKCVGQDPPRVKLPITVRVRWYVESHRPATYWEPAEGGVELDQIEVIVDQKDVERFMTWEGEEEETLDDLCPGCNINIEKPSEEWEVDIEVVDEAKLYEYCLTYTED